MGSDSTSRGDFLREGALGVAGAFGVVGLSSPVSAGFLGKDVIELEQVPPRTVIGKTEYVTWGEVAPVIARMRAEAREHFAATGVEGGHELTSFSNITPEGGDVLVGLEVDDAKGSPAISDGFTASLVSPPGTYMKDDHKGKPGMAPWIGFMARLTNDGYKFENQDGYLSMFEVYSGQGGKENVTMYTAVVNPAK
eukprot:g6495.t1